MIDRLIQIFVRNGADKVVVIINNESPLTKEHLAKLQAEAEIPLEVVVKTTPSSMHSFYELSPYLQDDKFCLTTVDTIFREEEFSTFIETFKIFIRSKYTYLTVWQTIRFQSFKNSLPIM